MQKKSTIKQNILHFIDYKGISKYKFYQETGITRSVLDQDTGMCEDNIAKFLAYYSEVNPEWLLSGKGKMLKEKSIENIVEEPSGSYSTTNTYLPLIPIEAMAGFGTGSVQVMEYEAEKFMVPTFRSADFLIGVKGSSMYPKYNSGDIVACKKLSIADIFFQWNKVYVLDTEQGALIKRVKKSDREGFITLHSDNAAYEPFEISIEKQLFAIAIVVGVIREE